MSASYKHHFSRFLGAGAWLHAAAHSHHPWPDASFEAQQQAWLDAAELIDGKWDLVFGEVLPRAQAHVARRLNLPDTGSVCFGGNTHEFLLRLLSCVRRQPARVLCTDGEFHSFSRQLRRLEEAGLASVERVAAEPGEGFAARFAAAAARGGHDLVYFSQCFYNSGFLVRDLAGLVAAVPDPATLVVIDGYHGFMAVPTDLAAVAGRAFYLAGGYKYAMAGEGAVFMHCPPGYGERPVDTGWFAGFGSLSSGGDGVPYAAGGLRFMGATFDPSGLYRFNAVMEWLDAHRLTPALIHAHVEALQERLLHGLEQAGVEALSPARLVPPRGQPRGNFLCLRHDRAGEIYARLQARNVIVDYREDRLRVGLGIYHDAADVEELVQRCGAALGGL
jgi:selenocysteine lyase/cysteine desulfurase